MVTLSKRNLSRCLAKLEVLLQLRHLVHKPSVKFRVMPSAAVRAPEVLSVFRSGSTDIRSLSKNKEFIENASN